MIISPPFVRPRRAGEGDASWVHRMMPIDKERDFPLNKIAAWHGGVHLLHTDRFDDEEYARIEFVRAIADGEVVSFRHPGSIDQRNTPPLNLVGKTDNGYVLLRHETDIGENCHIVYYSLYMHLRDRLAPEIKVGGKVWRKEIIGQNGMVDNRNAFHFQVFCDNENMLKLTGRTTPALDVTRNGRADTVYGDIHFYLPQGTTLYAHVTDARSPDTYRLNPVYTSEEPLYVSMSFEKGDCTMVTRRQSSTATVLFEPVGEPLVNIDAIRADNIIAKTSLKYEYNLYNTACRLYPQNPSAGFELLRFGRVINSGHEALTPANAPLWRTVSFPGGTGMVNLAVPDIKKFSDADFPHWMGWWMVNDDTDTNSQCHSPFIAGLWQSGHFSTLSSRLICHFPLEWDASTLEHRFAWLKTGNENCRAHTEAGCSLFNAHASALCFDTGDLGPGRLWHFHPVEFTTHFRQCCWLSKTELRQLVPKGLLRMARENNYRWEAIIYRDSPGRVADAIRMHMNRAIQKHLITTPLRIACFLGNAIQETGWLGSMEEGYRYKKTDPHTHQVTGHYNIWYHPWHGRGMLQLTSPAISKTP